MVLNTSFNENEPVVCEPKEALDLFKTLKAKGEGEGEGEPPRVRSVS